LRGRVAILVVAGILGHAANLLAAPRPQPAAAANSIGIRLVDLSATRVGDPFNRSYIVSRPAPGVTITRQVEISNTTSRPAVVAVYPAGAGMLRGRFAWGAGHSRNELSGWTTVRRAVVRLAAGSREVESVTIRVPQRASAGERYAVIWAEVSGPASPSGVRIVNRVGVRMYISVAAGGAVAPSFTIGPPTGRRSAAGQPLVVAKVANDGGSTLAVSGTLTLAKGPGGSRAGPFSVSLADALAPGDQARAIVRLDRQLPDGPWQAELRLRSGRTHRAATATIRFPTHAVTGGSGRLPALVLIVGLPALAVLTLLLTRGRTRRGRGGVHPFQRSVQPKGKS
jgi:hypothetical protein